MRHASKTQHARHSRATRFSGVLLTAVLAPVLAVGLSSCAPETDEPGPSTPSGTTAIPGSPDYAAGQGGKDAKEPKSESSWAQPNGNLDAEKRTTELPASFPKDEFPLPADAVIADAGERGPNVWFVILTAPGNAEADALWDQVVQTGHFAVSDDAATPEGGRAAQLTSTKLRVTAVTIPQSDGTVQLSYDLSR